MRPFTISLACLVLIMLGIPFTKGQGTTPQSGGSAQPGGVRNPNTPRTDGQPPSGQTQNPPGQQFPTPGPSQNVMVDGTYQILAYEKFGQVLPGMNTLKVAIRNNILLFPGDGKLPGKMIQLTFGPNNTIILTPLDGRTPPVANQAAAPVPGVPPATTNVRTPFQSPDPGKIPQDAADTASKTIRQATGTPPVDNGQRSGGQGTGVMQPGNGTDNSSIPNTPGAETGVYVLSTEFFSISVLGMPNQAGPVYNNQTAPNIIQNPQANNNTGQIIRDPRLPVPPGQGGGITGPSQAVLVLRRIAN